MRIGDDVELLGHKGRVTWAQSDTIDITMSKKIGPIMYEMLAKSAQLALTGYGSDSYVFTFDRNALLLRDLRVLGNANVDNKCCCGGDSIGATRHPKYCPKFET